jgi:hypothetical protein
MGPAEQEEGGSLEVLCQPNIPLGMISRGNDVACSRMAPHLVAAMSLPMRAKERASLAVETRDITYRPRSVSSLLMRLRAMAVCVYV